MTRILILSKNSLAEQDLQCSLQRMNEEVYCSTSLLPQTDSCLEIIKYFSVVVISDTIATLELEAYLPILLKSDVKILRKGSKDFIKNGEHAWMMDEVDAWIDEDTTITEITEVIARMNSLSKRLPPQESDQIQSDPTKGNTQSNDDFMQLKSLLSKNEKRVLFHIYNGEGDIVSREQISQAVWDSPPTNSNMSQISAIIYRIKSKIEKMGFDESELQTVWGQGYRMGNAMHSFLSKNKFSVRS